MNQEYFPSQLHFEKPQKDWSWLGFLFVSLFLIFSRFITNIPGTTSSLLVIVLLELHALLESLLIIHVFLKIRLFCLLQVYLPLASNFIQQLYNINLSDIVHNILFSICDFCSFSYPFFKNHIFLIHLFLLEGSFIEKRRDTGRKINLLSSASLTKQWLQWPELS